MDHKIRHSLHIVITESWTVVWDEDALPAVDPSPDEGRHTITWEEGDPAPEMVVLRRGVDGSGWQVTTDEAKGGIG